MAILFVLTFVYFILVFNWGSRDVPSLTPVRSVQNVFYQGSQHNLVSIINNIDLLEGRIMRIQLGRHAEETLLTITQYGNIMPLEEKLDDNRLALEMTLSTSAFWATPIFSHDGFLIGVYFEEIGYGMFLERWLSSKEESFPCNYVNHCE